MTVDSNLVERLRDGKPMNNEEAGILAATIDSLMTDATRYREVRQRAYWYGMRNPTPDELDADVDEALCANKGDCAVCNGSGWVVRDPDIGTDQECVACDGTGSFKTVTK